MKKEWNDVREFHEKFGHPCPDAPRMLDKKRSLSRAKWMNEEVAEFLVAEDIYEQADAMIDLMYFALGYDGRDGTRAGRTVRNRSAG